ncbi:MAG: hypothetical protein ACRDL7_00460, partial [Gaiellaceae bacterium]
GSASRRMSMNSGKGGRPYGTRHVLDWFVFRRADGTGGWFSVNEMSAPRYRTKEYREDGPFNSKREAEYFAKKSIQTNPLAVFGVGNPSQSFKVWCSKCDFKKTAKTKTEAQRIGERHADSVRHAVVVYPSGSGQSNPPRRTCHTIAGTVYNRVKEIRAEKTMFKPGLYKHPFKQGVKLYALDDGALLVKSTKGQSLWGRA